MLEKLRKCDTKASGCVEIKTGVMRTGSLTDFSAKVKEVPFEYPSLIAKGLPSEVLPLLEIINNGLRSHFNYTTRLEHYKEKQKGD